MHLQNRLGSIYRRNKKRRKLTLLRTQEDKLTENRLNLMMKHKLHNRRNWLRGEVKEI